MLYQLSHVRMLLRDLPGTPAGSLRRCVRTVSDPGATTNSEREVREKICIMNGPWLLPSHHYPWSAADQSNEQPLDAQRDCPRAINPEDTCHLITARCESRRRAYGFRHTPR